MPCREHVRAGAHSSCEAFGTSATFGDDFNTGRAEQCCNAGGKDAELLEVRSRSLSDNLSFTTVASDLRPCRRHPRRADVDS